MSALTRMTLNICRLHRRKYPEMYGQPLLAWRRLRRAMLVRYIALQLKEEVPDVVH